MQRSALATNKRNHAKRAAVIAAILNFQIRTSSARVITRFKYRRCEELGMREDVVDQKAIAAVERLQRNKP